jgi:hypothetical protein
MQSATIKRVIRTVFDILLTAAVVLLVISLSFFAVKYLAFYAGIALLALSVVNLGLRYFPHRSRATAA